MALDQITSQAIASGAVTSDAIASGAVTAADIPDGEITSAKLSSSLQSIISGKADTATVNSALALKADSSSLGSLATLSAVNTANIVDGAVTNAKVTSVATSKLTGALPKTNAPSGSIINVYQATNGSAYTVSGSGTFNNLSITLTPTSSSSKFVLIANIGHIGHSSGGATIAISFTRNGSGLTIISGASYNGFSGLIDNNTNLSLNGGSTAIYVDSPSTTSSITYNVTYNCDGTKWIVRRGGDTYIYCSQQFQILEVA